MRRLTLILLTTLLNFGTSHGSEDVDADKTVEHLTLIGQDLAGMINIYALLTGEEIQTSVKRTERFQLDTAGPCSKERAAWMLREMFRLQGLELSRSADNTLVLERVSDGVFYGDADTPVEERLGDVLSELSSREDDISELELKEENTASTCQLLAMIAGRVLLYGPALPEVKINLKAVELTKKEAVVLLDTALAEQGIIVVDVGHGCIAVLAREYDARVTEKPVELHRPMERPIQSLRRVVRPTSDFE